MHIEHSLQSLSQYLGATLEGDAGKLVRSVADLQHAGEDQISFLAKKQFERYLHSTQAGAVIVGSEVSVPEHLNVLRVANPYLAYAKMSGLFVRKPAAKAGVHPTAVVHPSASVAASATVGPHCVVEEGAVIGEGTVLHAGVCIGANSVVGADCQLYPHAVLYHGVSLGDRVTLHSQAVIGSDGFGFAPQAGGWQKIHQLGGVSIGNDVEIGAGTAIDRGAITDTEIADGVIIDNKVHIAHNVKIGARTAIAGCAGIAGSTSIGADCTIGGFAAIGGHLTLADRVHLHGATVVTHSINSPGDYASCIPAQDVRTWRRNTVRFTQIDDWVTRIKKLEHSSEPKA